MSCLSLFHFIVNNKNIQNILHLCGVFRFDFNFNFEKNNKKLNSIELNLKMELKSEYRIGINVFHFLFLHFFSLLLWIWIQTHKTNERTMIEIDYNLFEQSTREMKKKHFWVIDSKCELEIKWLDEKFFIQNWIWKKYRKTKQAKNMFGYKKNSKPMKINRYTMIDLNQSSKSNLPPISNRSNW